MPPSIARRLFWNDLWRRPARQLLVAASVAAATGLLVAALAVEAAGRAGFSQALARLGADLVAVPDEAGAAVGQSYLDGQAPLERMDRASEAKIAAFDFVAQTSAQVYVQSLSGVACCSAGAVFLIGFEPATDFTVRPWLDQDPSRRLGPDDVLVGADFNLAPGDSVRFYGHRFNVAGRLEPSGAGLDRACFIPLETVYRMARESSVQAVRPLPLEPDQISVVMIKLKPVRDGGKPPAEAAYLLNKGVYEISALEPQTLLKSVHQNLAAVRAALRAGALALWPGAAAIIGLAFALAVNERRRELGLLRGLGASRRFILGAILAESMIVAGLGAAIGAGAALFLLTLFSRLIAASLAAPWRWPGPAVLAPIAAAACGLALATAALAAYIPARRALREDPHEAVRKGG